MSDRMAWSTMLIAGLLGAGCGGGGGTNSGDGGNNLGADMVTLTIDKACTDLATAACAKRQTCTNGANITRLYGTMDVCVARAKLSCVAAANAPGTGQTTAHLVGCVAAYPNYSCEDFYNNNPPAACIATGTLATGAACGFPGQCVSTYCAIPDGSQCGTCQPAPAVGASCATLPCTRNQVCATGNSTCVTAGALNASCDRNNPCGFPLSCTGATMTTMGTCKTAGATAGTACDARARANPNCDATLGWECNRTTNVCVALTYVAATTTCGVNASGDQVACSADAACVIPAAATQGTCVAPAADGAACDTMAGPTCQTPARCITGGAGVDGGGGTAGTCQIAGGCT